MTCVSLVVSPQVVHTPNVVISGSRHIGYCDHLVLNIGSTHGNIGKSLYYKWSVYFEEQFLANSKISESEYILTPSALETFGVDLLRIELSSENWVCILLNILIFA